MHIHLPSGDRAPHAGELFTDRESESEAFKSSLRAFRARLDRDDETGGDEADVARHNVLTFYGLGGVGKTALSERLEAWVHRRLGLGNGWGVTPATKVDATVRIDLHSSGGHIDLFATLLALRAGLAELQNRWALFDLAFAAYWSAVRPGDPLPQLAGRGDYGIVVAESAGELLKDLGSVADLAVGTPVGLGVRAVRTLVGELRRRADHRLGITTFSGFDEFLLRCADEPSPTDPRPELAGEIAALLAWELTRLERHPLVVVFVDTAERLALDPRRVSEKHLVRLVYRMPNVLFVLTGRDVLDWYDERRADLPHHGRAVWPGLIPGSTENPRQHLVGSLSTEDTRKLIKLAREHLRLPMTDEVVEELVTSSAGLPQYLELARTVAVSVRDARDGRQVQVADVTGSLESLVEQVLDGVPADEQRAIRAACLFRIFDVELVAAAANVDYGCAERAVQRPMIDRHKGQRFPYRMHDAVREAIRHSGHGVLGGWSERDWELAATRAAAATRRLHDEAKNDDDTAAVLDAVGLAIELTCSQAVDLEAATKAEYEDWLSRAIVFSPSVPGLRSRVPGTSRTSYGAHVLDFILAKSPDTPIEERVAMLRGIFASRHPLKIPAGRHLGYTLKLQYRWDEAIEVFDELVRLAPTAVNQRQGPMTLCLARRFVTAERAAKALTVPTTVGRTSQYAHGRPERYFTEADDYLGLLRRNGRQRELLEARGDHLVRQAFFHGGVTQEEIDDLSRESELGGNTVATRNALLATVLHRGSGAGKVTEALNRLAIMDRASSTSSSIGFRYALAACADALVTGNDGKLHSVREAAEAMVFRTRSWIPVECFLAAAGQAPTEQPTEWLEDPAVVQQRWADHLATYLARHRD